MLWIRELLPRKLLFRERVEKNSCREKVIFQQAVANETYNSFVGCERDATTSSGTEHDYFRSTPTKAATPISTPILTATNLWHRYIIGPTKTAKAANNNSPLLQRLEKFNHYNPKFIRHLSQEVCLYINQQQNKIGLVT